MIGGVLFSLLDPIVGRPQLKDILLPPSRRECLIHRLNKLLQIIAHLKAQSLSFSIELLQQLIPMNPQPQMPRQEYLKQRNHKLASILVLLITLSEKIQRLKEKLCGFSPTQFSPESIFEALDLTAKGYLDAYDIHAFLGNNKIRDKDILILFQRMGDQGTGRLTYLGYLTLLKPFFDYELARDLLMRDTVSHRKNRANEDEENLHEMQETVLILLNQLLLLYCICIAEHQELKTALIEEYMLNEVEIKEILGLGGRVAALTAIKEFIQCNSEYEIGKEQIKYLLAIAQTSEPSLPQEKYINLLFLPSRPVQRKNKRDDEPAVKGTRNLQHLHSNYTKDYLGKADLYTTSNRLSFLNYIHPSSFQKPVRDVPSFGMEQNRIDTQPIVDAQHKKLSISQDKFVPRPFKPQKLREKDHELTESVVEQSNLHQLRRPSARLQQASYDKIETPILQQFMHESNVKHNMGNYKARERDLELNQVMEESSRSESDGIIRVDYTSKEERPKPAFKNIPVKPYEKEIRPQLGSSLHQHSYLANKSNLSNLGETSGILNQFIRSEFR